MSARFEGLRAVHYLADDPGVRWIKDPQVAIGPDTPLDSASILTPNVVRLPGGGYRMYYTGWGPGRPVEASRGDILSARSTDGLQWTKDAGPLLDLDRPLDCRMVSEPCVIGLDDGRSRLYYEAEDREGRRRILSATSAQASPAVTANGENGPEAGRMSPGTRGRGAARESGTGKGAGPRPDVKPSGGTLT